MISPCCGSFLFFKRFGGFRLYPTPLLYRTTHWRCAPQYPGAFLAPAPGAQGNRPKVRSLKKIIKKFSPPPIEVLHIRRWNCGLIIFYSQERTLSVILVKSWENRSFEEKVGRNGMVAGLFSNSSNYLLTCTENQKHLSVNNFKKKIFALVIW